MLNDFHFLRPLWLGLLPPLGLLVWQLRRTQNDGDAWRKLVDPHLLPHLLVDSGGGVKRLPLILLALGWLLLIMALAGPTWERLPQPVYQTQQFTVVALDLSASMNASDLRPSRLTHARFEVLDLLRKTIEGQTALLAYGAEPYLVSPLTTDIATIAAQVPSLETSLLPVRGSKRTDLVLDEAGALLKQAGARDGDVVLVTDALDHPAAASEAARRLVSEGYRVSVLGVGTAKGAPVPLEDGGFLKDSSGAIQVPKLNVDALRSLAMAGGGQYVSAGAGDKDIEALLARRQVPTRSREQAGPKSDQWREQGPWLLVLLLPIAVLAFRRGWVSPLLLLVVLLPTPQAQALSWTDFWSRPDQQAMRKFEAGEAEQAAALFQQPAWHAAAEYAAGNYDEALRSLAGQASPDAAYNEGNALARLGRLEEAVAAYNRALAANPDDADARHNRDLVQRLLEQRQAQQNQRGQQQDQQGQQAQRGEQSQPGGRAQEGQHSQQAAGASASQRQQRAANEQQQDNQQSASKGASSEQAGAGQQAEAEPQNSTGESERPAESNPEQAQEEGRAADESVSRQASTASGDRRVNAQPQDSQAEAQGQGARSSEQSIASSNNDSSAHQGNEPGLADLLGGNQAMSSEPAQSQTARIDPEDLQAMEQMLRRVEDDPAGLLRQRFLLQHLRRSGQLP